MAANERVARLRADSGIVSIPPPSFQPEAEPEEARNARLNLIQLESLGSRRRDRISREDFPENQRQLVSWRATEALRLSNQPGTTENKESQVNEVLLSKWNNAWKDLQDDGTVEERLDDINRGQTHRAKLMNEINANKQDYEDLGSEYRRHHADGSSRGRGGGRGGRGGGVIGSRSRSTGRKRVPVGVPAGVSSSSQPSMRGLSSFALSGSRGSWSRASTGLSRGPGPGPSQDPSSSVSPHRRGLENLSLSSASEEAGTRKPPSSVGSSSRGPASSSRGPVGPIGPIGPIASRPVRLPQESIWSTKLATPDDFMSASKGLFGSSSRLAPETKSTTTSIETALQPVAAVFPAEEATTAHTISSSPAALLTTSQKVEGVITKNLATDVGQQHGPTGFGQNPAPREHIRESVMGDPHGKSSPVGSPTQSSAGAYERSVTRDPLEPSSAKPTNISSIVSPEAGAEPDEDSALIEFGDDEGYPPVVAHSETDVTTTESQILTSPRISDPYDPQQSYTGDLLGLEIQPDDSQRVTRGRHPPQPPASGEDDSHPSLATVRDRLISCVPTVMTVLGPESMKSLEHIVNELQRKSESISRTRVAAAAIEPTIEAFGRLSIHDRNVGTRSGSDPASAATASTHRSTVRTLDPAVAATANPFVHRPKVRLPVSPDLTSETIDRIESNPYINPSNSSGLPDVGSEVHGHIPRLAGGPIVAPHVPERRAPTVTARQEIKFEIPVQTPKVATRKPPLKDIEDSGEGGPSPSIFITSYPSTTGSSINRTGFFKDQALKPKKENVPLTARRSEPTQASSSSFGVLDSRALALRPSSSNISTSPSSVPPMLAQVGNVVFEPTFSPALQENAPLTAKRSEPTQASSSSLGVFGDSHALAPRPSSSNISASPLSVPPMLAQVGNVVVEPTSSPAVRTTASRLSPAARSFTSSRARATYSTVESAPRVILTGSANLDVSSTFQPQRRPTATDDDDEEDYPLEDILKTTSVPPPGLSRFNQSGFFKKR